nr:HWE histidine kinase domain-containing protein [Agrobacterium sp. rho-13.3]
MRQDGSYLLVSKIPSLEKQMLSHDLASSPNGSDQSAASLMNAELDAAHPSLVSNDDLLAALLSGSADCIKIIGLDGSLQFMSDGGKRVMEVDDFTAIKGCPWPDFWQGEGNNAAKAAIASAKAGIVAQFFGAADTAKGNPKFWDVRVMPVRDKTGTISHLLSISTDITETKIARDTAAKLYKDAQDASAKEADALRRLLQHAPSYMCVFEGPNHVFELTNDAYLGLVGYRNVIGLPVREALPEIAGQGFYELLDSVYETGKAQAVQGQQIEVERTKGGEKETAYVNFVYQPVFDQNGNVTGIFVEGSDITDVKRAEFALLEKERQLMVALDAARMGVWESTLCDGSFVNIKEDARAAQILGTKDTSNPSYTDFSARVHEEDRTALRESVTRALDPDGDAILDVEYRIIATAEQPEHWVHARAAATRVAEGIKFIGTVRDITHRKDSEARQRLLAGELQHRIKNTFAMVQAIASQTLRGDAIAEQRDMFNGRLQALGQAHDLLLDTSQEEGKIVDVITKALAPYREYAKRFELDGPNITLSAKQTLSLAMAVHELATNATKYGALSNDNGRVTICWSSNTTTPKQPLGSFTWQEREGPTVVEPTRRGFGSRVISRLFASDFSGGMVLVFAPTGLECTFVPHSIIDDQSA